MRYVYLILASIVLCSCGNKKKLLLPEINNASITEIHDVSHAYLFYDETQVDSVELNRKNLISTTNWLVNVDKRLTLEQAIPKIKFLQDKKRKAKMHKNEAAKNYYTCNDTSIQNLGFIEFTNVHYIGNDQDIELEPYKARYQVIIDNTKEIQIIKPTNGHLISNREKLVHDMLNLFETNRRPSVIILAFSKALSFQEYISFKSMISKLTSEDISISKNEFIY